jgi:hypothetical protein
MIKKAHIIGGFVAVLFNLQCDYQNVSAQTASLATQKLSVKSYQRKTTRTYIFSRAQFKYSLGNPDYLNKWIDRPLFVDPILDAGKAQATLMSQISFNRMVDNGRSYGLDGFSFFPQNSRRDIFFDYFKAYPQPDFKFLPEFFPDDNGMSKADVVKLALNNPAAFKIDGKVVITSYNADQGTIFKWQNDLSNLKRVYGDKFIFLPSISKFAGTSNNYWIKKFRANTITSIDIESIKEYLRKWARATDGLYYSYVPGLMTADKKFDQKFYEDFVIVLMKSVINEPEFKSKYWGLSATIGHENVTRAGLTLSSDGTKTLRRSMDAALAAQPDIINIPEWDEQNENTSLGPTVYNGLTTMRIMRYYTDKAKGKPLTVIQGDNTQIPNLAVSYRKVLSLGEKLDIELLNIPDNANTSTYSAKLKLLTPQGNVIYTSGTLNFNKKDLADNTVSLPSEQFADYPVVIPQIEITDGGKNTIIKDGLHYIELRPTWNWDYKWVKQDIRDLIVPNQSSFNVTDVNGTDQKLATASFSANDPLAYVEVLDNDDVVYSYSKNDDASLRTNNNTVVISADWQSFGSFAQGLNLSGSISLKSATAKWTLPAPGVQDKPLLSKQLLSLTGQKSTVYRQRVLLQIPKAEINTAVIAINIPGIYVGDVAVKDIVQKKIVGIPGPKGFNLVLSNFYKQDRIPEQVNANAVNFTTTLVPDVKTSVFHLQAITKSGKEYRSMPVLASNVTQPKVPVNVYSDSENDVITINVADNRLPKIKYEFDPSHGSALVTDAGKSFWGILGGFFSQVTNRGGASGGDDSPFIRAKDYPKNNIKSAPDWVKENDGSYSLKFNGQGTFVSLPQGVIPKRASYVMEMDIYPQNQNGKQIIFSNQSYYPGSLTVLTDNGALQVNYTGEKKTIKNTGTNLSLPPNQWSHLKIVCTQSSLTCTVNNKQGTVIPIKGPAQYDTSSVLGGFGTSWFNGRIKNFLIDHGN